MQESHCFSCGRIQLEELTKALEAYLEQKNFEPEQTYTPKVDTVGDPETEQTYTPKVEAVHAKGSIGTRERESQEYAKGSYIYKEQETTSREPLDNQETTSPRKNSGDSHTQIASKQAHQKHAPPIEYGDLYGVWNKHRGPLPECVNNDAANKLLKTAVKMYSRDDLLVLVEQGAQEVAGDSYWLDKRYGLVNLLRNLDSKAEAYRSRGGLSDVDARNQQNYKDIMEAVHGV